MNKIFIIINLRDNTNAFLEDENEIKEMENWFKTQGVSNSDETKVNIFK